MRSQNGLCLKWKKYWAFRAIGRCPVFGYLASFNAPQRDCNEFVGDAFEGAFMNGHTMPRLEAKYVEMFQGVRLGLLEIKRHQ